MNNGRKECTFLWFIENYSDCWHENRQWLKSPVFTFHVLEGTAWELGLYPKGNRAEDEGNVSLILYRKENDAGPDNLSVKYEFSLLAADGSTLHSEKFESTLFQKNRGRGSTQFLKVDERNLRRKADYLPDNMLIIRCRMCTGEGDIQNAEKISARTRIFTEQISFFHIVKSFSKLQPNVKQTKTADTNDLKESVSSTLYFDGSGGDENIIIDIVPPNAKRKLHKCKFTLMGNNGIIRDCGRFDYAYDAERLSIYKVPLTITREVVLNRKTQYLKEDNFCLLCECTFLTEIVFSTIEEAQYELPLAVMKKEHNQSQYELPLAVMKKEHVNEKENIFEYASALEDIKSLYINQRLTDVKLKTKTKSFPAHKMILCARSSVFEAMLTSDMREKNTACVQVDDLEDDIVEKFLLFLYSDNLETLQWKSATQLYYAADKYQVGKLKAMCSSFLAENLSNSNASELLLLADTHNDSNLNKVVEDFILKHEEQVYCSNGWEKLKLTNPQLVIKTMCLKYGRKN